MKHLATALLFLSLIAPGIPVASATDAQVRDEAPTSEELMDEDGKIVSQDKEPMAQSSTEGP